MKQIYGKIMTLQIVKQENKKCALGDFLVLFAPVLRQIARYLPHHRSENASKTHPKSSHDKFKTASKKLISSMPFNEHK